MNQNLATIIRLTKLTETSLIVTWVSDDYGLIKTVAKGARNAKSKYSGMLDLFYTAEISWIESKKSELHQLSEVNPISYRQNLATSYLNTELASYFATLLESIMEPDIPADGLHDLLQRGLNHLTEKKASLKSLYHFENEAAKLLGIYNQHKSASSSIAENFGRIPLNRARCIDLLN